MIVSNLPRVGFLTERDVGFAGFVCVGKKVCGGNRPFFIKRFFFVSFPHPYSHAKTVSYEMTHHHDSCLPPNAIVRPHACHKKEEKE